MISQSIPLVCVCIPNYNNEKTINKTLDSLINQTYKNIRIKIFDNASTDNSIEILKKYEKEYENIQIFQNKINIGGEANFTKCIQNLEGEFGAIFHADDLYTPTMVEEQVQFLIKYSECSAVSTYGFIIDENSNIISKRPIPNEFLEEKHYVIGNQLNLLKKIFENGNFITCPSVLARTDIYKNKIIEWKGEQFKTSADLDVWLRLAEFGKFGYISNPLIYYRESTASYSFNDRRARLDENNMFLVLEYYLNRYKDRLDNKDLNNLKFLYFKDNINRTINQIIKNNRNQKLDINCFDFKIISLAFKNKDNFKIYLIGLIVKFLRNFGIKESIRNKLYEIRFGKKI